MLNTFNLTKRISRLFNLLTIFSMPVLTSAQQQQTLPASLLPDLSSIGHMISAGKTQNEIQSAWKVVLNKSKNINVDAAINYIITDAKKTSEENVVIAKKRVGFDSLLKIRLSDELKIAKNVLAELNRTKIVKPLERKSFMLKPDNAGNIVVRQNGTAATKEELSNYIKELESKMESVGDDAQKANVDMQNTLQRQQQVLQMLSTISKLLSDTAMAVIRKIGG